MGCFQKLRPVLADKLVKGPCNDYSESFSTKREFLCRGTGPGSTFSIV